MPAWRFVLHNLLTNMNRAKARPHGPYKHSKGAEEKKDEEV
jgi:hypothetical protein